VLKVCCFKWYIAKALKEHASWNVGAYYKFCIDLFGLIDIPGDLGFSNSFITTLSLCNII